MDRRVVDDDSDENGQIWTNITAVIVTHLSSLFAFLSPFRRLAVFNDGVVFPRIRVHSISSDSSSHTNGPNAEVMKVSFHRDVFCAQVARC